MDEKKTRLDSTSIGNVISQTQEWLELQGFESRNIMYLTLSIEELLLRWQDHFHADHPFTFSVGQRFKQPYLMLCLEGEEFDPTVSLEEDIDWSNRIFSQLGLAPEYSYKRGTNKLTLRIKKQKTSGSVYLLLSIIAALLFGFCGKMLIPQHITAITEGFITPFRGTLLSLISAVAVPMVFLSVLLGICETGSASEFGKIGNRMLLGFVGKTFLLTAFVTAIILPFFSLNYTDMSFSPQQLSGTFGMILDILPPNIVEPFNTGNTLQVIVIAIALGLALLVLGESGNDLKDLAKKAYSVIELLLQWVCRLLPVIVFLILLETMWGSNLTILIQLWKPVLIVILCAFLSVAFRLLWTSYTYKISPFLLLKKLLPAILITLSTASSAAALGEVLDCCQSKLGIHRKIACFGIPTGAVMYMPVSAVYFMMCILYGAEHFEVSCSVAWLFLACMTSSLLAVAVPPIPGGAMACYTVMFMQMGIPAEAIVFAIAMDILIDRFDTTSNVALLQLDLIHFSDKQKMLNRDTLKKE